MGKPGAKKLDKILSVTAGDVHIIIPPTGTPVPVPHPCTSIIKDRVATTVKVMGQPGAVKGSISKHTPPHIPQGGTFSKPPSNRGEIFLTTSLEVYYEGKKAAVLGDTAKMCADPVDMPVGKVIGTAAQVLVAATSSAGGGAGDASGQAQVAGHAGGATTLSTHPMVGHPVDVVTGNVVATVEDLALDGPLPIQLVRTYVSAHAATAGPLGFGWAHNYQASIERVTRDHPRWGEIHNRFQAADDPSPTAAYLIHRTAHGEETMRHDLADGATSRDAAAKTTIARHGGGYVVLTSPHAQHHFVRSPGDRSRYVLSQIVDRHGNALTFRYDDGARLAAVVDPYGRTARFSYTASGRLRELTVSAGSTERVWCRYEYDGSGDLVAVTDRGGGVSRYAYAQHLLTEERSADAYAYFFQYDALRRCICTWGEDGYLTRRLRYDIVRRVTQVVNGEGESTLYHFDAAGRTLRIDREGGYSTQFVHDEDGRLIARRTGEGVDAELAYDDLGRIAEFVDGAGVATTISYDDLGRCRSIATPAGFETTRDYDEAYDVTAEEVSGRDRATYEYDVMGRRVRATAPDGVTTWEYDRFGHVTRIAADRGPSFRLSYDPFGRLLRSESDGRTTEYEWDDLDRMVRQTENGAVVLERRFNFAGHLLWERDAAGRERRRVYSGPLVHELHQWHAPGTAPIVERYGHDREGRLRAVHDGDGMLVELAYNDGGQLIRERFASGWARTREYDRNARLACLRDSSGAWRRFGYDGAGRLLEVRCSDGTYGTYEYDEAGRLSEASTNHTTLRLEADRTGNITGETQNDWTRAATFDERGRRVALTVDGFDHEVRLEHDPAGRVHAVRYGEHVDRRTFTASGRLERRAAANGVEERREYDDDWRLVATTLRAASGETLYARRMAYDAVGRVGGLSDGLRGARTMVYDDESRLRRVEREGCGVIEEYRFDGRGDVLSSHRGAWDRAGDAGQPCVATVHRGNGRALRLEYNALAQLVGVHTPEGESWRYEYDGLGRRLRKIHLRVEEAIGVTSYLWDGHTLVAERSEEGQHTIDRLYVWAATDLLFRVDREDGVEALVVHHGDHLGSPDVCTDEGGNLVWHSTADAFGARTGDSQPVVQNIGFPGQYWDAESGLFYNRHRHYDPFAARYVQPDPLGVSAGWHPYAYPGDPLSSADPSGLAPTYKVPRRDESEYVLLSKDPALTQLTPLNPRAEEPNINRLGGSSQVCAASGHGNIPERLSPPGASQLAGKSRVVIESHGEPGELELDGVPINGKDLGEILHQRGFTGDTVVLVVCNAGTPNAQGSSVAQDLADELKRRTGRDVEVIAATGVVVNHPDGTLSAGAFRPGSPRKKRWEDWDEGAGGATFMSFSAGRPPEAKPPPPPRQP